MSDNEVDGVGVLSPTHGVSGMDIAASINIISNNNNNDDDNNDQQQHQQDQQQQHQQQQHQSNHPVFSSGSSSDFVPDSTRFDDSLIRPLSLGAGEDILLPFVEEYSKLQQALVKSHDSEVRFVSKCKALLKQIRAHSHKLTALQQIHIQDQKRKTQLQLDIDKARAAYNKIQDEITLKKEQLNIIRNELNNLGQSLEESSNDFLRNQRNNIAKLELDVNKLTQVRDKERAGLTRLRTKNVELFKQLQELLAAQSRSQQEYDGLESRLLEAKALAAKEIRKKIELEKNMKDLLARVQERQQQVALKKEHVNKASKELNEVDNALVTAQKVVDNHKLQYDALNNEAKDANESLLDIQAANENLISQLKESQNLLDKDKQATKQAKQQAELKRKQLEIMREKVRTLAEETREEEDKKTQQIDELKRLKENISALQFKLNINAKAMDTCVREREVLAQNHSQKIDAIKQKETAIKIRNATLKNTQNEHAGYLVSIRALTKILEDIKKDKTKHEVDLSRRLAQQHRAEEEVITREGQIAEYQKQILLNEAKMRQQINLIESVRSDRNLYRKQLIEAQNETFELKRRFFFLNQQLQQHSKEIEEKNQFIVFEHFNRNNVRDDIGSLEIQNKTTFKALNKSESTLANQTKQIRKLSTILQDADEELRVQIKQYNSIVSEQRVLNQQLVQRNDELAKLYESLKLQNSILNKSANHYQEKQLLLTSLENQYTQAQQGLDNVLQDVRRYSELNETIQHVKQQLTQAQLKVKALEEETKKPINIHRWRRLMDTDTETYGMIKKVRVLQKELIAHTAAVEEKEKNINEKEGLYVELRKVLARQPGSEAAEQLRLHLQQMDEKRAKLKTVNAELKLYTNRCKEFQFDIEKLNKDLQLIKLSYFQKRRAQQRKQQQATGGGGGGGGGGGAGAGGQGGWMGNYGSFGTNENNASARGEENEDIPDILRPTQFNYVAPPAELLQTSSSSSASAAANAAGNDNSGGAPNDASNAAPDYASFLSTNPFYASSSASSAPRSSLPASSSSDLFASRSDAASYSSEASRAALNDASAKRSRSLDEESDADANEQHDDDTFDDGDDYAMHGSGSSRRSPVDDDAYDSGRQGYSTSASGHTSLAASRPDSRSGISASSSSSALPSARTSARASATELPRQSSASRFPSIPGASR